MVHCDHLSKILDNARRRDRDVPGDDGYDGEQPRAAQRQRRPHRQLHVQVGALIREFIQGARVNMRRCTEIRQQM